MPFSPFKNLHFDNKDLHFSKQDMTKDILLAFFILSIPFTALLPHGRVYLMGMLLFRFYFLFFFKKAFFSFDTKRCLLLFFFATVFAAVLKNFNPLSLVSAISWALAAFFPWSERGKEKVFPKALAVIGALLGLFATVEVFGGKAAAQWSDVSRFGKLSRAAFPFGNPNLLGAFLAPCAIFALSEYFGAPKKRKILFLSLFLLSGIGLSFTYSRGAWLGFFVGCSFFLWKKAKKRNAVFACCIPSFSFFRRLISVFSPDSSVSYRFSLWRSVGKIPPKHLLFGAGEGKEALYRLLSPYMAAGLEKVEHTHSLYLHVLTAEGILGLSLFALALFFGLRKKSDPARVGALLSLLTYGIFDDPLYSGQIGVLFWFLVNVN